MADENSTAGDQSTAPQPGQQPEAQQPVGQPQQPHQATGQTGPQPQQPLGGQPGYQPGVPPYGTPPQNPGFQPPQGAPAYYAQPQPQQQPRPLLQLTGGMKFGWFAVGFLIGIAGPLIAWLTNLDKAPQVKSEALKWSIVGAVVGIGLNVISFTFLFGSVAALSGISAAGSSFVW